jgi:hypothetical protein
MKVLSRGSIVLIAFLFCVPLVHGQDLSKYRTFTLGMNTADVLKSAGEKPADVAVIHEKPSLIQELTWYPPLPFSSPHPVEPVEKVVFSFCDGELYRIVATYNSDAIQGLSNEDMIKMLSTSYGTATTPVAEISFPTSDAYQATQKVVARWEDAQFSLNLFRPEMAETFAIVMFNKQVDLKAGLAIAQSAKLEKQEAPQKEAARVKQAAIDTEAERQKNIKAFRP